MITGHECDSRGLQLVVVEEGLMEVYAMPERTDAGIIRESGSQSV